MKKSKPKSFTEKVKEIVRKIPKGSVMTYLQVAKKAGNPKGSRAVGSIMRNNFDPNIPCHRVIMSDGTAGTYNRGGEKKKIEILKKEGYIFKK
jgi:O-6-methylguanine DNA methyltransferase